MPTSSLYLTTKKDAIILSNTNILTPTTDILPTFTYTVTNTTISLYFQLLVNGVFANYYYSLDDGIIYTLMTAITSVLFDGTQIYTITGLTPGAGYFVRLKVNSNPSLPQFITLSSNTPQGNVQTIQQPPTITSVTPGNASVSVSYTVDNTATNIQYSLDGTTFTQIGNTTSPFPISSGLTNGTTYNIVLQAIGIIGTSFSSNSVSFIPSTIPTAPTLSVSAGNSSASLSFSGSNNGDGSAILKYQYSFNGTTYVDMGLTSPYSITGLTNGATYSVVVRAVNANGNSANSNSVSFISSTIPAAPSISISSVENGSVTLNVTAGSTGGSAITNYRYSAITNYRYSTYTSVGIVTTFSITGLTNGTTYNIQMDAVNTNGDSMDTASISFTPISPILDTLSTAAKTAMLYAGTRLSAGALGINRLYSGYTGPTIQIKNGATGTPTDFYPADTSGNLVIGTGITLASFLGASQAYVTIWYDQTGNGNHAISSTGVLPKYDTVNKRVDFTANIANSKSATSNAYFTLANGAFPFGTGDYNWRL